MSRTRRPADAGAPIVFQASLPDSGAWVRSDKEQSTILLIVPLQVGAVLTAATERLADRVLKVTLEAEK